MAVNYLPYKIGKLNKYAQRWSYRKNYQDKRFLLRNLDLDGNRCVDSTILAVSIRQSRGIARTLQLATIRMGEKGRASFDSTGKF